MNNIFPYRTVPYHHIGFTVPVCSHSQTSRAAGKFLVTTTIVALPHHSRGVYDKRSNILRSRWEMSINRMFDSCIAPLRWIRGHDIVGLTCFIPACTVQLEYYPKISHVSRDDVVADDVVDARVGIGGGVFAVGPHIFRSANIWQTISEEAQKIMFRRSIGWNKEGSCRDKVPEIRRKVNSRIHPWRATADIVIGYKFLPVEQPSLPCLYNAGGVIYGIPLQ